MHTLKKNGHEMVSFYKIEQKMSFIIHGSSSGHMKCVQETKIQFCLLSKLLCLCTLVETDYICNFLYKNDCLLLLSKPTVFVYFLCQNWRCFLTSFVKTVFVYFLCQNWLYVLLLSKLTIFIYFIKTDYVCVLLLSKICLCTSLVKTDYLRISCVKTDCLCTSFINTD